MLLGLHSEHDSVGAKDLSPVRHPNPIANEQQQIEQLIAERDQLLSSCSGRGESLATLRQLEQVEKALAATRGSWEPGT